MNSNKKQGSVYTLKYCPKCIQMTNHIGDDCLKCTNPNPIPATPSPSKEAEVRAKAKELFDKFCQAITGECPHTPYCDEKECQWKGMTYCKVTQAEAKQCALICVDEIITTLIKRNPNYEANTYWSPIDYWQQVRTAINQL